MTLSRAHIPFCVIHFCAVFFSLFAMYYSLSLSYMRVFVYITVVHNTVRFHFHWLDVRTLIHKHLHTLAHAQAFSNCIVRFLLHRLTTIIIITNTNNKICARQNERTRSFSFILAQRTKCKKTDTLKANV